MLKAAKYNEKSSDERLLCEYLDSVLHEHALIVENHIFLTRDSFRSIETETFLWLHAISM